jgi:hypothetical protein
MTNKFPMLTDKHKRKVHDVLRHKTDLDETPSVEEAVGIIEPSQYNESHTIMDGDTLHETEIIRNLLQASTPQPPNTTDHDLETLFGDMDTIPVGFEGFQNVLDMEAPLLLDDGNPLHQEPNTAQLFNNTYQHIYEPGLLYPQQLPIPTTTVETETQTIPPTVEERDIQVQPSYSDVATNTTQTEQATSEDQRETRKDDVEDVPLLQLSQEHFREVNRMKNAMITQILQDNIQLTENKLQSRKRALQAMETLFEERVQQENQSDDLTLELSRIIHLKNKFIRQLLRETGQIHSHVYNAMTQN